MRYRSKKNNAKRITCNYRARKRLSKKIRQRPRYGLDRLLYANVYKGPRWLFPSDKDKEYIKFCKRMEGKYSKSMCDKLFGIVTPFK